MPAQKNRKRLQTQKQTKKQAVATAPPAVAVEQMGGTALARYLMDPQRNVTVLAISHMPEQQLRLDAEMMAARLGPEAHTVSIVNGRETHQLERALPPGLHVFGTAARVYPHGADWQRRVSRPHLAHHDTNLNQIYDVLETEVLTAQRFNPARPHTASMPVITKAVVKGFPAEDMAMVELLPSGNRALIRSDTLAPGIPLDWLVSKGQELAGVYHPATGSLNIQELLLPRPSPVTVYQHGDVALARVKSVCPSHATVQLWPGSEFRIGVERISSNDLDSAQDLLTAGEVVRARVLYDNGAVRLSMLDVDDDEPVVPAPPLVRGGPPWLDLSRPYASIFTTGSVITSAPPNGLDGTGETELSGVELSRQGTLPSAAERRTALQSTQMQLEAARRTIEELLTSAKRQGATDKVARALQDQLECERRNSTQLARDLNAVESQVEALKSELARTRETMVLLRKQRRNATSRSESTPAILFLDPAQQFDFDVQQVWARTVPAADKAAHPLGRFSIGPQFLESWAVLTEQQRNKTLRAVVDLVTDRQGPLRKREPHKLRLNEGAHSGPTLRGDDVCWRLYVEQGTSGALRLHYWRLAAGGHELHAVVPHDVVKP